METLCSIMLLEKLSIHQVLSEFLKLRRENILHTLDSFKPSSDKTELLSNIISQFYVTFRQVISIFYSASNQDRDTRLRNLSVTEPSENSISILKDFVNNLGNKNHEIALKSSSIHDLYSETTNVHFIFRYLPTSLKNLTEVFDSQTSLEDVSAEDFSLILKDWRDNLLLDLKNRLYVILCNISSGVELDMVRNSAISFLMSYIQPDAEIAGLENLPISKVNIIL